MKKINYVNCILISEDKEEMCVIFKQRGPTEVVNKFNFIGGKVEENENSEVAVKREVKEETGLDISTEKITIIYEVNNEDFNLTSYVCYIPKYKLKQAKTCESEKISVVNVKNTLQESQELPNKYANNFRKYLQLALSYKS